MNIITALSVYICSWYEFSISCYKNSLNHSMTWSQKVNIISKIEKKKEYVDFLNANEVKLKIFTMVSNQNSKFTHIYYVGQIEKDVLYCSFKL